MKKLIQLIKNNFVLFIFALIVLFISFVSVYKIFVAQPTYVYVKVKLGQGLWWAQSSKPTRWFVDSIKAGEKEYDPSNNEISEIVSINYYPVFSTSDIDQKTSTARFLDQYDIYLNLRLGVSVNKKIGKYYFKRQAVGVGSPIDFEFSKLQISGTVIRISEKMLINKLVGKTIYLIKTPLNQSEYDSIVIGSYYNDGENNVFEIKDKFIQDSLIHVKANIKLRTNNDYYLFGEEEVVTANKMVNFLTNKTVLYNFVVDKIE